MSVNPILLLHYLMKISIVIHQTIKTIFQLHSGNNNLEKIGFFSIRYNTKYGIRCVYKQVCLVNIYFLIIDVNIDKTAIITKNR